MGQQQQRQQQRHHHHQQQQQPVSPLQNISLDFNSGVSVCLDMSVFLSQMHIQRLSREMYYSLD